MKTKTVWGLAVAIGLVSTAAVGTLYAADAPKVLTDWVKDAKTKQRMDQMYAETSYIRDPMREIIMFQPLGNGEELGAWVDATYEDTPFIREAIPGKGIDYTEYVRNPSPLPYYFNFNFEGPAKSEMVQHPAEGTIRISAKAGLGGFLDEEVDPDGYFDLTLYSQDGAEGTYRFSGSDWSHADWENVSAGPIHFRVTHEDGTDVALEGTGAVVGP